VSERVRIKLLPLVAVAAWALWPGAASAVELGEGQVQIELRPLVTAREPEVRLGDVANIYTRDLPTIQRLSALPLGQAPLAGSEAVVRRDVIARWVRSQLGIGRDQVVWSGPEETHVRRLAQELPSARIEQAAKVALNDWLQSRASRYGTEVLPLPADLKLPAGRVELKARPLVANAEPTPRMVVWMDVLVEGRFVRAVPVSFNVEAYREAWVAPSNVARGVALAPGMVAKREVDITHRSAAVLPVKGTQLGEAAAGWTTTKALKEGEPITERNVAPAPLVARGEWVALHLKSGLVQLEGRAQALQDGELGQVVQVRSTNGASPVAARIVAPGKVEAML
jgi:flagellar basal body P-ring formation protein FlgA